LRRSRKGNREALRANKLFMQLPAFRAFVVKAESTHNKL